MLPILSMITILGALTFLWVRNTPAMREKLAAKQDEVVSMVSGSNEGHGTIARRLDFYNSTLDAVAQHPFTGLGLGGWSVFYSGKRIEGRKMPTYPHDFLLEVASEQGLPGLALLLGLLASLFYSARKVAKYPQFAFLLPVFIFEVFNHVFTGSIEDRNLWFWCGMVVALSRIVYHSELRAVWPSRNGGSDISLPLGECFTLSSLRYEDRATSTAKESPWSSTHRIDAPHEKIPLWLGAADCLVLPSLSEGIANYIA